MEKVQFTYRFDTHSLSSIVRRLIISRVLKIYKQGVALLITYLNCEF
jgi:hypothetical protein